MPSDKVAIQSATLRFDTGAVTALLRSPGGAAGKELLRRGLMVEAEAKRLCPVRTGRLRSSITHEMGQDSDGLYADIGTDVEYAAFVEFGTSRMPARPFLRPALDAAK